MFTFRTSITFAVMAFVVALTVLLIAIQLRSLRFATKEAASAYMDATSIKVLGRLQGEFSTISSEDPHRQQSKWQLCAKSCRSASATEPSVGEFR